MEHPEGYLFLHLFYYHLVQIVDRWNMRARRGPFWPLRIETNNKAVNLFSCWTEGKNNLYYMCMQTLWMYDVWYWSVRSCLNDLRIEYEWCLMIALFHHYFLSLQKCLHEALERKAEPLFQFQSWAKDCKLAEDWGWLEFRAFKVNHDVAHGLFVEDVISFPPDYLDKVCTLSSAELLWKSVRPFSLVIICYVPGGMWLFVKAGSRMLCLLLVNIPENQHTPCKCNWVTAFI